MKLAKRSWAAVFLIMGLLITMLPVTGMAADAKFSIPASAVSASADDGNVPGNTVDGDLNTRWSASGDGQWIQFDLGSNKKAAYIKIAFLNGSTRTSTFDIQRLQTIQALQPLKPML